MKEKINTKFKNIEQTELFYLNSLTPGDLRMKLTYEYRTGVDVTNHLELILNNNDEKNILEKGFEEFSFGKGNLILYKLEPISPEEKRVCFFFKKNKEKYEFLI